MCFVIAMIGFVLSFNFFMASNILGGIGSLIVALVFMFFMIRNIVSVRKIKREKQEAKDDN